MSADDFCKQYVNDMIDNIQNVSEYHGNTHYRNNIFYSWRMPICQHFMIGFLHYFEVVDKEESPSSSTTKHIGKIINAIQEKERQNPNVSITYVREIVKREKRNELD